jgi:hypothetical protein
VQQRCCDELIASLTAHRHEKLPNCDMKKIELRTAKWRYALPHELSEQNLEIKLFIGDYIKIGSSNTRH